ncbi:MAG: caspase family protein [Pseudomonadota bacterium]
MIARRVDGKRARLVLLVAGFCLVSCAGARTEDQSASEAATEGRAPLADLFVVDCLLPGQVRQLGRRTYIGPRRPTRATASDCRLRGGEYVEYDRADYQSALNVWLEQAKAGNAEAQTHVGEIFERGLGTEPDYALAALWYRKAAEQGNERAQFNLGTLYELGRGVEQDRVKALNLYRAAWGLSEDDVMFASAARRELDSLREQLEKAITERDTQINLLRQQLTNKQAALDSSQADSAAAAGEIDALKNWLSRLESEREESQQKLASMQRTREPGDGANVPAMTLPDASDVTLGNVKFGRYFALIIGVQDYDILDDLDTPVADVQEVQELLESRYGFSTRVLTNADHETIMRAVVEVNEQMGDNDNLLIYYAGHGDLAQYGEIQTGHWLPSNAEHPPRNTYWIDNSFITQHLSISKARRILVVADSCYAGLLSSDPAMIMAGPQRNLPPSFLEKIVNKPARLVLSSGGERPVLDGGGDGHSVFARAFLEILKTNEGILPAPALYSLIDEKVRTSAADVDFVQEPQLRTIKSAGHALGQFFFVPN